MSGKLTSELEANDLGQNHGDLLTEHDRLSLDTADTPADNTKTIDHSSVRISSHNGVWVKHAVLLEDDSGEPLKVDLMDDTVAGWDNTEVAESRLSPLEEGESLLVALKLDGLVLILGVSSTCDIDLN